MPKRIRYVHQVLVAVEFKFGRSEKMNDPMQTLIKMRNTYITGKTYSSLDHTVSGFELPVYRTLNTAVMVKAEACRFREPEPIDISHATMWALSYC